jgi:hypothetical protein
VVVADMRNGRNSNQHLALGKAMGIAQALGCALQEPDFCVKAYENVRIGEQRFSPHTHRAPTMAMI